MTQVYIRGFEEDPVFSGKKPVLMKQKRAKANSNHLFFAKHFRIHLSSGNSFLTL